MNHPKFKVGLLTTAAMLVAAPAFADDHESDGPDIRPIEGYTCNYNEGKSYADLQEVIDNWNEWMDDNDKDDYFAATMTPFYHGPDTFDISWIGGAPSAEAMGAGADAFATEGGEIGAAFASVLTCDTHINMASMRLKEPPEDTESPNQFVATFSDCKAADGKSMDDVFGAIDKWTAHQIERGYTNGGWAWFPVYGAGGEQKFDFKWVESYGNHQAMGADWDKVASGDYAKSGEIFAGVLKCDVARVYDVKVHRSYGDE